MEIEIKIEIRILESLPGTLIVNFEEGKNKNSYREEIIIAVQLFAMMS